MNCISAFLLVALAVSAGAPALAQNSNVPGKLPAKKNSAAASNPVQIDPSNAIRLTYGYSAWNKSTTEIDSGSLIMREGESGRLVQIHLVETEPNSAIFSGVYSINWQNIEKLRVEFYVPPQDLLESAEGMKKVAAMITKAQLRRNPFILRRTNTGAQTVEIFDTREQAQMALRAYKAQQQVQGLQNQKYPTDQAVATAELAAAQQLKEAAAKAATDRIRMEQLEAQKLAAMLAKEAQLSALQKAEHKKQAAQVAAEALVLYRENKFPEATAKFNKAVDLDPDNHAYYFQYGVALYKVEDFNRSLVYLSMANGSDVNPVEKDFFVGLDLAKLKDTQGALDAFDRVVASRNAEMAPSAMFYKGLLFFEQKKWDDAKVAFQGVMDNSKDPDLDKRAETYFEQILRIQQFETERARKWQLSATLGEMYDSNIILLSDSQLSQGTATNTAGYRTLFTGSARYRPIYEETREFAAQLDLITMYTVTDSFNYDSGLRNADPTVVTLTAPYTHKGVAFGKGYKFDLTPGYETIFMSVEDNQNKLMISSFLLNFANLFVMNEKLYSNFNLELRRDKNMLEGASFTGDNDSSAMKLKLINSNLHFLTDDKAKILTTEGALTINQALGKSATYNRLDLAVGYIQPWKWETSATAKLGYYYLSYPEKSDNRLDNNYALTLGASKKLNEILSSGLVGNYSINSSSNESNTYKKWTVMLTLSALYGF